MSGYWGVCYASSARKVNVGAFDSAEREGTTFELVICEVLVIRDMNNLAADVNALAGC